jgi:hypothetical protein
MRLRDLLTGANLIIALIIIIILLVLYGNKSMVNDLGRAVGIRWVWVPVIIIVVLAVAVTGKFFFRKKDD